MPRTYSNRHSIVRQELFRIDIRLGFLLFSVSCIQNLYMKNKWDENFWMRRKKWTNTFRLLGRIRKRTSVREDTQWTTICFVSVFSPVLCVAKVILDTVDEYGLWILKETVFQMQKNQNETIFYRICIRFYFVREMHIAYCKQEIWHFPHTNRLIAFPFVEFMDWKTMFL